jgi:glycopeptide antibiotics resistance protein
VVQGLSAVHQQQATPIFHQRPRWLTMRLLACLWTILIVYGTLLPFDFSPTAFTDLHPHAPTRLLILLTSPRWIAASGAPSSLGISACASDLATNLALYLPLGILLHLATTRAARRPLLPIARSLLLIALLSWSLECLQSLSYSRVASLNDFFANTAAGFTGVLLAPHLRQAFMAAVFFLYRKSAHPLYLASDFFRRLNQKPLAMFALVLLNITLIVGWYASVSPAARTNDLRVNWLPFVQQFARSYDVAALYLGRSIIVYTLIAMMLSLMMLRAQHRRRMRWILLTVALLSAALEALKTFTTHAHPDITEPLIAIMAAGFVFLTLFLFVHAVRCACRRIHPVPVDTDRRRRPHDYSFALRAHSQPNNCSSRSD